MGTVTELELEKESTTAAAAPAAAAEGSAGFKLVGYKQFVRSNPRTGRFPVLGFHHVEFWCGDATTAAGRFSFGLGMPLAARSDLSTGNTAASSLLLRSGDLSFLFTAPISSPTDTKLKPHSVPSFDPAVARRFSAAHGLAVRAVAVHVPDAAEAFRVSVAHGARPAFPPADLGSGFALAEVELYGDVVLRYVQNPNPSSGDPHPSFLPGFEDVAPPVDLDYGLRRLDHAVGNVAALGPAVAYVAGFTGFHDFAEFTSDDVGTAESGLNSVVLADDEESALLPMNEPIHGTARRSQIQTYLDHNGGPGVQHLALASGDIIRTLREMRQWSAAGGFEFMPAPPATYYRNLKRRVGDVLTAEQIEACEELGVLVDRDDQGVLLQIFTKPIGDRPTIFLEIIQRIGCMVKDDVGRTYQKGGCGGFGKGNFAELFKSIEEYEKSLDAKLQPTPTRIV